jgi:acyl-CoA thioester hydrolase
MPAIFEHPLTVARDDLDLLDHASNVSYVKWMQDAALAHSAVQGWPTERYQSLGCGWVVRSHQIEYLQPALLGQELIVSTWVANMKKVTSLRRYRIVRPSDNVLVAQAATDWAFIHFATNQPKRIPPEVASAFEVVEDAPTKSPLSLGGEG